MLAKNPNLALAGENAVGDGERQLLVGARLGGVVGVHVRQHLLGLDQSLIFGDRNDGVLARTVLDDELDGHR